MLQNITNYVDFLYILSLYHFILFCFFIFTENLVGPEWAIWIGLTNLNDQYKWVWKDSSPANFLYWRPGHPQNGKHCGYVSKPKIFLLLEKPNVVSYIHVLSISEHHSR